MPGIAGASATAPGHAVTVSATLTTASIPQPIGVSATASRLNGISTRAQIAHGMTQSPVNGTAIMLAATPYSANRLKL